MASNGPLTAQKWSYAGSALHDHLLTPISRVIFAGDSRPYWFCIAALGPAVMAYLCAEMWNDRRGARLTLVILTLLLGAFCWGTERRLATEGVEDPWLGSLALTFITTIAPIFTWLRARTRAATATQSHQ